MINEILNNLECINDKDYSNLTNLLINEVNPSSYFNDKYNEIMDKWSKEFDVFDIPSGIISICINDVIKYYKFGKNNYDENTIFDIASMTKIYTEIILFEVLKEYNLTLNTKISELVDFYKDINYLTLMDLISFNNTYYTKVDIRNCDNKEDALKALRTAYIDKEKTNYYLYTDLPIMILTDIIEVYTHHSYKELFDKYIIKKYNLSNTYLKINNKNYVTINKNLVNDPKANIMGGYYGHAGVKASSKDFISFFSRVFDNENSKLFTSITKTKNNDGSNCINKALIGNFNLSVKSDESLASRFLPKNGFAIQGSVRCHAETCIFNINGKEYRVTTGIFLDLYTQYENILKYEKNNDTKISKTYTVGSNELIMTDVRSLLSYKNIYKDLTNIVGICRVLELFHYLNE